MNEPNTEGVSLDGDLADLVAPSAPEPEKPAVLPDGEVPEDNTVLEASGTKIDVGPLLAAERKRVREATEQRVRAEYAPLQQQAQDMASLKAELAALRQQVTPPKQEPAAPEVTDSEAETYARRHQLYGADSTLDLKTAKSILAETKANERRLIEAAETRAVQAAKDALAPVHETEAKRAAHDNFLRIAATQDAEGNYVFKDPQTHPILLEAWNALPDALRALPEVGEVVVNSALGKIARTLKRSAAAPLEREPVLAEAANNRGVTAYTISNVERKVAEAAKISTKDWEARAKTYQPGQHNSLED
jgi:hypothetical protein